MTYSVSRRGNQYGIVDDSNMFIDDWAGKKDEAEAKANDLNNASSSHDDVVNVDSGEETKADEPSARAPFADSDQPEDQEADPKDGQDKTQPTAKPNATKVNGFKGFRLTNNGWQQIK